ncbi:MAG: HAD family hydrolase [Pseudomonadota bacterium]
MGRRTMRVCSPETCEIRIETVKTQTNGRHVRRAVFLDRDGVINAKLPEDRYVKLASEFKLLPGVIQALCTLRELGYLRVVITNQRGIGRGLMTEDQLKAVHDHMVEELRRGGAELDAVYYCPHDKHENCGCRKPQPGMIFDAVRDLHIDAASSYMVGDSSSDIVAGKLAGTRTVRITEGSDDTADLVFPNLAAFARFLEDREGEKPLPGES